MRALVQRVSEAGVYIASENYKAEIKKGDGDSAWDKNG